MDIPFGQRFLPASLAILIGLLGCVSLVAFIVLATPSGCSLWLTALYRWSYASGAYRVGEMLYRPGIHWYERVLGQQGASLAGHLDELAVIFNAQAKYEQSEPLYKRSLMIYRQSISKSSPWLIQSMILSAEDYASVLEITDRAPMARQMLEDLATTLSQNGEDATAEKIRDRLLASADR
jgi:hypothetical protein